MGDWSGKRGSNPRPSAWKADALPTELFPQLFSKLNVLVNGGGNWIRTSVGECRRVYSPLPLAARASPHQVKNSENSAELAKGLEPATC